jgi:hypothetical protein
MSPIKRRQFLQFAGFTLATLGLSQLDFHRQAHQYARVLAQQTPRKLALLVGINKYPPGISSLRGCLTDVEMQYELLVHRFGFNPKDILLLTDDTPNKPTRQNLLDAFETHLIEQAQPGDIVVFHYSGHGSLVLDPDAIPIHPDIQGYNGTMVVYDSRQNNQTIHVNDIMGKTLFLLMSALNTENVTVVLDSCHSGGGTRGNLVYRALDSRLSGNNAQPSAAELAYQERWMTKLGLSLSQLKTLRTQGIAKGMALGSAQANQLAADAPFGDFYAGAFTYLLTRYLWQQSFNKPLATVFANLARSTRDVAQASHLEQDPIFQVKPNSDYAQKPLYFLDPDTPAAEAVVRRIEGDQVIFWLGGISSQSLQAFEEGAEFNLIDTKGQVVGEVVQTNRLGLVGYGRLKSSQRQTIPPGTLMRERIRGVPANLALKIGLHESLGNQTEAARAALETIERVNVVPVNTSTVADYLLGRMSQESLQQARQRDIVTSASIGSIGLFSAGLTPVPDSFGQPEESITQAVQRLRPRLTMLLAGRILHSVLNSDTSHLNITVDINPLGRRGASVSTGRSSEAEAGLVTQTLETEITQLQIGTEVELVIHNHENRSLYIGVLVIFANGDIYVLHPITWGAPEEAAKLGGGESMVIPQKIGDPTKDFRLIVQEPAGFFELLVLTSTEPLRDALKGLQDIARRRGASGTPLGLTEDIRENSDSESPVAVIDSLLGDLDRMSRGKIASVRVRRRRHIDTTKLAALSTILKVVE